MSTSSSSCRKQAFKPSRSSRTGGTEEREDVVSSTPPWNYQLEKLFELAPYFWGRTEHSDCTLIILHPSNEAKTYHLHLGYVASQSPALLNAFMGVCSPPSASSTSSKKCSVPLSPPPSPDSPPAQRVQRVLDSDKPTLRLTLPDPMSFELVLHFLYWGDSSVVEGSLDKGDVGAEGLMKNLVALRLGYLNAIVDNWCMKKNLTSSTISRSSPPERTRLYTPPPSDDDSDPESSYSLS